MDAVSFPALVAQCFEQGEAPQTPSTALPDEWNGTYRIHRAAVLGMLVSLHTRTVKGGDDGVVFTAARILDKAFTSPNWQEGVLQEHEAALSAEHCRVTGADWESAVKSWTQQTTHGVAQHCKTLPAQQYEDEGVPFVLLLHAVSAYVLAVKDSGSLRSSELVEGVKFMLCEVLAQPLELVRSVLESSRQISTRADATLAFIHACSEAALNPAVAAQELAAHGTCIKGVTDSLDILEAAADACEEVGNTRTVVQGDGELYLLLESFRAVLHAGAHAAQVANNPVLNDYVCVALGLRQAGLPFGFADVMQAKFDPRTWQDRSRALRAAWQTVTSSVRKSTKAALGHALGVVEGCMLQACAFHVSVPTAYTLAHWLLRHELRDEKLAGAPETFTALTVAAWGQVKSAPGPSAALHHPAMALAALQSVLLSGKSGDPCGPPHPGVADSSGCAEVQYLPIGRLVSNSVEFAQESLAPGDGSSFSGGALPGRSITPGEPYRSESVFSTSSLPLAAFSSLTEETLGRASATPFGQSLSISLTLPIHVTGASAETPDQAGGGAGSSVGDPSGEAPTPQVSRDTSIGSTLSISARAQTGELLDAAQGPLCVSITNKAGKGPCRPRTWSEAALLPQLTPSFGGEEPTTPGADSLGPPTPKVLRRAAEDTATAAALVGDSFAVVQRDPTPLDKAAAALGFVPVIRVDLAKVPVPPRIRPPLPKPVPIAKLSFPVIPLDEEPDDVLPSLPDVSTAVRLPTIAAAT